MKRLWVTGLVAVTAIVALFASLLSSEGGGQPPGTTRDVTIWSNSHLEGLMNVVFFKVNSTGECFLALVGPNRGGLVKANCP